MVLIIEYAVNPFTASTRLVFSAQSLWYQSPISSFIIKMFNVKLTLFVSGSDAVRWLGSPTSGEELTICQGARAHRRLMFSPEDCGSLCFCHCLFDVTKQG